MSTPTEAQFIYYGMNKEKWPCLSSEQIQYYLDSPESLDSLADDFIECFHKYFYWYWGEQRA